MKRTTRRAIGKTMLAAIALSPFAGWFAFMAYEIGFWWALVAFVIANCIVSLILYAIFFACYLSES